MLFIFLCHFQSNSDDPLFSLSPLSSLSPSQAKTHISGNQELFALGMSNLVGRGSVKRGREGFGRNREREAYRQTDGESMARLLLSLFLPTGGLFLLLVCGRALSFPLRSCRFGVCAR